MCCGRSVDCARYRSLHAEVTLRVWSQIGVCLGTKKQKKELDYWLTPKSGLMVYKWSELKGGARVRTAHLSNEDV